MELQFDYTCTSELNPYISVSPIDAFSLIFFLQAAAAGKVPVEVLRADADALAAGQPLPYARIMGDPTLVSNRPVTPARQVGPLDHS